MKAQEMFKELGYEITATYPLVDICYELISRYGHKFFILFDDKFRNFTTISHFKNERNHTYFPGIDVLTFKAIHQQMIELGWIK